MQSLLIVSLELAQLEDDHLEQVHHGMARDWPARGILPHLLDNSVVFIEYESWISAYLLGFSFSFINHFIFNQVDHEHWQIAQILKLHVRVLVLRKNVPKAVLGDAQLAMLG